jgi:hypothetical protein
MQKYIICDELHHVIGLVQAISKEIAESIAQMFHPNMRYVLPAVN